MLLLTIAALLAAPPAERHGSETIAVAWEYPGMLNFGGAGGRRGTGPIREEREFTATTADDFDTVVAYYQKRAGLPPDAGGSGIRGRTAVIDDSRFRPLRLRVVAAWWSPPIPGRPAPPPLQEGRGFVSVTISRAEGEKFTHIDLIYRNEVAP